MPGDIMVRVAFTQDADMSERQAGFTASHECGLGVHIRN